MNDLDDRDRRDAIDQDRQDNSALDRECRSIPQRVGGEG
jgi:hypothetical protein